MSILTLLKSKNPLQENYFIELILLRSALLLKIGAAPFHFWLPEVIAGLNWSRIFILVTWQKIAPIILLSLQINSYHNLFFSIIIISSSIIRGLQGLNQTCLRKILAYSSINHVGWIIRTLFYSINIWLIYIIIYSIININIILIFKKFNTLYLNQLRHIFNSRKKIKFLFILNFLSLGGLPPFLGFFPKWIAINSIISNTHYLIAFILIIFRLISLYFYLRISFSTFTLYTKKNLIILINKSNYFHFLINTLSLIGIIICRIVNIF